MCTIIVTIRSVLWAVMTIAGSLMILVSLFTNRWLIGGFHVPSATSSFGDTFTNAYGKVEDFVNGRKVDNTIAYGIFLDCVKPEGSLIFEGECIPNLDKLKEQMLSENDNDFPHAWKGGIACFTFGLAIMVFTVVLSLLTPCCRYCFCCSVFTFCGSVQMFSAILFTLGLLSYPAGWESRRVRDICGTSEPFYLGQCQLGGAYWMAVAGTVCTALASSLTVFAYKSTKSHKTMYRRQDGDKFICVP